MLSKTSLQTSIRNIQEAQLRQSRLAYAEYLAGVAPDRTEPREYDQASQAFGNAEFFEGPTRPYEVGLKRLQSIDVGLKSCVQDGAVVQFNDRWWVVGVATQAFVCDGLTYMGISTPALQYGFQPPVPGAYPVPENQLASCPLD